MSNADVPGTWQERAGLGLAVSWDHHARRPYATELLCALMRRYRDVAFVVAFDGFFYDDNVDEDESRTLSLWVVPLREGAHGVDYRRHAQEDAYGFITAWVAGWDAARAVRGGER